MDKITVISLSPDDLHPIIKNAVKEALKEMGFKEENTDDLLTRKQTAEHFSVSLPTLHSWTKKGKLKSFRINSRIFYKKSLILNAVEEVPSHND